MISHVDGVPLLGLRGDSGSGKTTLCVALARLLTARGQRVGYLKHSHHDVEPDHVGKDSHALRHAGARQVLLATPARWALFGEEPEGPAPDIVAALRRLSLETLDVVLVEGYRHASLPRLEIHRRALHGEFVAPRSADTIAVASDQRPAPHTTLPLFDLDDVHAIAAFVHAHLRLRAPDHGA